MKGKWMKIVRQYTIITLGISMMAVGVYFFKFPNNFVFGGVTGAAALAAKLTPISASEFSAVVNMLMLLLGLIFLGKEFALTTGYATVVLSAELMLLEKACPLNEPLSDQPMLELIFAIALPAIASALLFSVGQTEDQIRTLAAEACMSFNSVHMEGFDEMSQTQIQAFDSFIKYAQSQGTTVVLVLSPWHPYLYGYLLTEPEMHKGFFQVENWLRQYCADNNIPLYGSYDPACIEGLQETDFFDGLHCGGTGIARFFPGIPQALADLQNATLANPLDVHPRTSLEDPNAQPAEGETPDGETPTQEG